MLILGFAVSLLVFFVVSSTKIPNTEELENQEYKYAIDHNYRDKYIFIDMANTISITLLILGSIFSLPLSGQKIDVYKGIYTFENDKYKFKELGNILQQNDEAYAYFLRSEKLKKNLTVTGIFSGAFLIGGTVLLAQDRETEDFFPSGTLVGGALCYVVSITTGIITLAFAADMNYKQKLAIESFNEGKSFGHNNPIKLQLGTTANGAGLVLSF